MGLRPFALRRRDSGFSMIELLISLTLGLILLTALSLIFLNSSEANRELQKTAQQIENGRYATELLSRDLRHAGFYGHLHEIGTAPASLPDPCETASTTTLFTALSVPIQGYRAPSLSTVADVSATTCDDKGLLPTSNLRPGSDVLVIRRADTQILAAPGSAIAGEVYLQATGTQGVVQIGGSAAPTNVGGASLFFKDGTTAAPVRKLHVHVYFVAPCSVGTGSQGVCASSDDTIPTLKRLELTASGGATTMRLVPLVEGIEYLKLEYGIDTAPPTANISTGLTGDATVDSYTATPAVGNWPGVIAAKVYVLARNNDRTLHYTDDKSYTLGTVTVPAANDNFKRHVFTAAVRVMNTAGRREIP